MIQLSGETMIWSDRTFLVQWVCYNAQACLAPCLFPQDVDFDLLDPQGFAPLHYAVVHQNTDMLSLFVSQDNVTLGLRDRMGCTALWRACEAGNFNAVKCLCEKGASPNIADNNGVFPLHVACEQNDYALVCLLLSFGADVNVTDCHGKALKLSC